MRRPSRRVTRTLAYLGLAAAVLTGLEVGIQMAADAAGMWGILGASAVFPATIAGAPLLALVWGQWIPALVVYGGALAAGLLFARSRAAPGSSATS